MLIAPELKVVVSEGILTYEERTRAWSTLRIKKEVTYLIPALRERSQKISYHLKVFLSLQAFQEFSEKVMKKELPVPTVLYFQNEKES